MLRMDRKPEKGDRWVQSIEASLLRTKTDRTNGKYPAHLFYNLEFIIFGSPSSEERNATTRGHSHGSIELKLKLPLVILVPRSDRIGMTDPSD